MMMSDSKTIFTEGCALAFDEEHWQKINYSTGCFENNFAKGKDNYRNLDLEKQRAYTLRNKSLLNLEKLLVDFETHFNENGGKVLWARNADDALTMIFDIIRKERANAIMRSNSTVLDETWVLARAGNKPLYAFALLWMLILSILGTRTRHKASISHKVQTLHTPFSFTS